MLNGSWRTTTLGIIGIIGALIGAAQLLLDSNAATNPDWTILVAQVSASVGLLFSRDNKVTSEEAHAK